MKSFKIERLQESNWMQAAKIKVICVCAHVYTSIKKHYTKLPLSKLADIKIVYSSKLKQKNALKIYTKFINNNQGQRKNIQFL